MKRTGMLVALVAAFAAGAAVRGFVIDEPTVYAQAGGRVFELRTYTANPGKLDALQARFRDHTLRLFEKHGMQNVGYWRPTDAPRSENTLIYILAHRSREAAKQSWSAFAQDPDWKKAASASEANGALLAQRPDSVFMEATPYSPMK